MRFVRTGLGVCLVGVLVGGCGPTYYRVTDPTTNRNYYTTELKQQKGGGVRLKDAGTGRTVTLQNSEVMTVKKEEFETGKVRTAAENAPPAGATHAP
jgi:hypothetical protein